MSTLVERISSVLFGLGVVGSTGDNLVVSVACWLYQMACLFQTKVELAENCAGLAISIFSFCGYSRLFQFACVAVPKQMSVRESPPQKEDLESP